MRGGGWVEIYLERGIVWWIDIAWEVGEKEHLGRSL
jgi:hypothetical protein